MKNIKRQVMFDLYKLIDIFLIAISFLAAIQINFNNAFKEIELRFKFDNLIIATVLLTIGHYTFKYLRAYDSKRFSTFSQELISSFKAVSINSLVLATVGLLLSSHIINNKVIITYFILNLSLLFIERSILILSIRTARVFKRNMRLIAIVGTNKRAIKLSKTLPSLGYTVLGFIDTKPIHDLPYPLIEDYETFLRDNHVDEIIICSSIKTQYGFIEKVISFAECQGILVRLVTDLFDLKISKAKIEYFEGQPVLTLFTGNMYRRMVIIKEIFDTIIASIALLLVSPVFILAIIAIKLTSKGPVFFLQERLSTNKKIFKVYKFRTMGVDAEEKQKDIEHLNERAGEAAFKIKNDPRVTPIGKILRKFSIDELPQLINVIKGDMSLVGPRPLPVRDYKKFNEDWQRRRFSVKPGITCTWQISGRDKIKFEDWMKMDNEYIDTWSFWKDIKILILTIPAALFGHGAS